MAQHHITRLQAELAQVDRQLQRQHGLAPHRCRQFKISTDPNFARKAQYVFGLYLDPPAHALVLSVDEKTQIQAQERNQASLPLQSVQPATQIHDYIRHGTTALCAALHVQTVLVQAQTQAKHRQQEFLAFLDALAAETPAATPVHVILDNYATHKNPRKHTPGWRLTPTGTFTVRPLPVPG